jgi:hypothetical protein
MTTNRNLGQRTYVLKTSQHLAKHGFFFVKEEGKFFLRWVNWFF